MVRAFACLVAAAAVAAVFGVAASATPAAARCQPTRGDAAGPFQQITTVAQRARTGHGPVSYTHLTLPTN